MIGTRVTATIWQTTWRYRNPESLPGQWVTGRSIFMTADPSGADLCDVARLNVLPGAVAANEFGLISGDRVADAQGLAQVAQADRSSWGEDVRMHHALDQITNGQMATIGDLGKRLALAEAQLRRQEPVIEACRRLRESGSAADRVRLTSAVDELVRVEGELPAPAATPFITSNGAAPEGS